MGSKPTPILPSSNTHNHLAQRGHNKQERWLSVSFLRELIRYELQEQAEGWHLQFDFDSIALPQLLEQRFGRTIRQPNGLECRASGSGYAGQPAIERVFRGLRDGD